LRLKAGSHALLLGVEERPRMLDVRAGRMTRLDLTEVP
jgi:hypothetical protein